MAVVEVGGQGDWPDGFESVLVAILGRRLVEYAPTIHSFFFLNVEWAVGGVLRNGCSMSASKVVVSLS